MDSVFVAGLHSLGWQGGVVVLGVKGSKRSPNGSHSLLAQKSQNPPATSPYSGIAVMSLIEPGPLTRILEGTLKDVADCKR